MHKIDYPGATPADEFTDGDPDTGIEATVLGADWHNTIQRELIALLTVAGLTPSKADDSQVRQAVQALIAAAVTAHATLYTAHGATSAATASRPMLRDTAARSRVANPSHDQDCANKGYTDGLLDTHAGLTAPHSSTSAATALRLALRDANGRCNFGEGASGGQAVVYSQFGASLGSNGYQKLPNGWILQWGTGAGRTLEASYSITFPIAFPTVVLAVLVTTRVNAADGTTDGSFYLEGAPTVNGFSVYLQDFRILGGFTYYPVWIAIGR